GSLFLDTSAAIATAPDYPVRGHQLGYRNTANSYDAWDLAQFEQYIRDLVVFGANAIELIPPDGPDSGVSPHFKTSACAMNVALSQRLADYGLDVWYWLPVKGDFANAEEADADLAQRGTLFAATPRLDDVFVPGGDPGHTEPVVLMPFLERLAAVL